MKNIFFILVLFHLPVYSQQFEIGAGFVYGFGTKTIGPGPGASLTISYKPIEFIHFKTTIQTYFADFNGIDPYVPNDSYSLFGIEESIIYYPFEQNIQPYGGFGIGYYAISHSTPGIGNPYLGYPTYNNFENKKLGFNIILGLKLFALTPFSVDLNLKYLFLNQHLDARWRDIKISEDIDLNVPLISLALLYNF